MKQKIIVSSKNPVKIDATSEAFSRFFDSTDFEIEGVSVPSHVPDQPMSEQETMLGASNRVENAFKAKPNGHYWVGIEGGIHMLENEMMTFAWVFIKDAKKIGKGRSASFFLPQKITRLVKQGKELGDADDIVFGKNNSKQQNGGIGLLTQDIITRTELYIPAIIMALIPFKNKDLYE